MTKIIISLVCECVLWMHAWYVLPAQLCYMGYLSWWIHTHGQPPITTLLKYGVLNVVILTLVGLFTMPPIVALFWVPCYIAIRAVSIKDGIDNLREAEAVAAANAKPTNGQVIPIARRLINK